MNPPWKIPSRPCPFFARGNCFFSENCNFLHEVSPKASPQRSASFDDSYEEGYQSAGNSPVLQSRFSVDFDSSSEDETNGVDGPNYDDEEGYLQTVLLHASRSLSPSPSRSSFSSRSRKSSTSPSQSGDAHIRDSIMTVKVQSVNFPQANEHRASNGSDVSSFGAEQSTNGIRRKHSHVPQLSVSIPHQFGSIRAAHRLVLQGLKETLKKEDSPLTSPDNLDTDYQVVTTGSVQGIVVRHRSGTIRPQHQQQQQQQRDEWLDKGEIGNNYNHPSMPMTSSSSSFGTSPSPSHGSTDAPIGSIMGSQESTDGLVSSTDIPESKPKTPQTPSWLKPLKLAAAILGPQPNTTKFQEPDQPDLPQSQSFSPTSLLAQYSLDPEDDDMIGDPTITNANIPINSPRTIVLSDTEDDLSSAPPSRASTLDIDMTSFPSARSEYDDDSMSSAGSVTLSVLMGGSPKLNIGHGVKSATSSESVNGSHRGRMVSPRTGDFHTTLEKRARRIKESVSILNMKQNELKFVEGPSSESLTVFEYADHAQESNIPTDIPSNISEPPPSRKSMTPSPRIKPQRIPSNSGPPKSANSTNTRSPDPSYRPQLLFAIASDEPEMVEDLLATGQSSVDEMADSGTDLLEFTVSNGNLKHKTQIVKTLLKYGADPAILTRHESQTSTDGVPKQGKDGPMGMVNKHMNAAMEYFLTRQSLDLDSKPALQALQQSSFAPLAKARFDIIGQDRVLDEFYRVIGVHSQRRSRNALVILLCGASGLGKSFLAQKVGSLLNVPIHTINMTALRSQHDLWQCLSTGAEDASPNMDLGEFLVENQGRRCVVVLDEIEKVDDPKVLNPLLLPWDIGRCSLEQKKHTDTSQVFWIATSNLGQKIIAEHVQQWKRPDIPPNRNEYIQLATAIRRSISEVLGAPLLSRITAILPFLPFTTKEKRAIATEAVLSYQDIFTQPLSAEDINTIVDRSVGDTNLVEEEGARSLYRVVEAHMINLKESNNGV